MWLNLFTGMIATVYFGSEFTSDKIDLMYNPIKPRLRQDVVVNTLQKYNITLSSRLRRLSIRLFEVTNRGLN